LTGRGNYRAIGERIGVDLVSSPDLASNPETEVAISAALWSSKHVNEAAQADNLVEVMRGLMGPEALASLHARSIWLSQAKAAVS
jgi:predicted chitinase